MPSIECQACHRRFVWKAELSGKVVRCDCGTTFAFPAQPDAEGEAAASPAGSARARGPFAGGLSRSDFLGEDEHAPAAPPPPPIHCPSCNLLMKGNALVCLNCGYDLQKRGRIKTQVNDPSAAPAMPPPPAAFANGSIDPDLAPPPPSILPPLPPPLDLIDGEPSGSRRSRRARIDQEDANDDNRFTDLYLPVIFIIAGVGITMLAHLAASVDAGRGLMSGVISVGLQVIIMVPLLLGTFYMTAHVMDMNFGPLKIGMLKITAIAVGPLAMADWLLGIIMVATFGFSAGIGMFIYAIVAGIPLSLMFDLDFQEMMITLFAIIIVRMLFSFVLLAMVLSALL